MTSKKLINLSNLQKFLSKLNERFALKKAMKGITEDSEGNIIIGEEGLVPTPDENSKGKFLRSDGEWAVPGDSPLYDSMTLEEGVAGVSEVDKVLNAKNLKQIVNSDGFLTSLDSSKLTGVINIENLPQGALERILIVSSKEERLTLSETEVQLGDVVKESDTGLMYYVINTEKLNSEEGYTQFTAGSASSVPWSGVTDKPLIPTKTSELTNDSNFAIDSNVVHTSGNETISGSKTFSNQIYLGAGGTSYGQISAKDNNSILRLFGGTSAGTGANLDLYGEGVSSGGFSLRARTSDKIVGLDGKVDGTLKWNGKNVAIDENLVHTSGNETINGIKSFTSEIYRMNNAVDRTTTPSQNLYSTFTFLDKARLSVGSIQHCQRTSGVNDLSFYVTGNSNVSYGVRINSNKEFSPIENNTYSLGTSGSKWANVYSTNNITNKVITYSVTNHDNTSSMTVSGGSSWDTGSTLFLYGNSHSNYPGAFNLTAKNTTNESKLIGFPNGTLTWNGKSLAIDENLVHKSGNETIDGAKTFTEAVRKKNSALDLQVNPSSDQHNHFLFTDKNNAVMGYLEHTQTTTGVNAMGLVARDKSNKTHGFQVTSEDNVIPFGNGVVNLGLSGSKWKNVYATTFNGNLKGNADTATRATSANSVAWANVTGKPNLATTTFVEKGNGWYRKHSDGFIEQFFYVTSVETFKEKTINFYIPFTTIHYNVSVIASRYASSDPDKTDDITFTTGNDTMTYTKLYVFDGGDNYYYTDIRVYVCGY